MLAKTPSRSYRAYQYFLALPITAGLLMLFSFTILDNSLSTDITSITQKVERIANKIAETPIITTSSEVQIEDTFIGLRTPYIFYWGHFQVFIMKHETSDIYFGEINLSHTEFFNSIDREPRLFNGKNLEDRTLFQVMAENENELPVEAILGTESVYEKYKKELESQFTKWHRASRIDIKELSLPNGYTANLTIHFSAENDRKNVAKIKKYELDWAGRNGDPERHQGHAKLCTSSEFWQMAASAPKYYMNDAEIKMPASITIVAKNSNPRVLEFETGKPETYEHVLESLKQRMDLIEPGTKVYLDFTNAPSNIFYIIDDHDPRLTGASITHAPIPESMDQSSIRILQSRQTPTKFVIIGFETKEDTEIKTTVFDPNGKVVFSSKKHHSTGRHAIELSDENYILGEYTVTLKSALGDVMHKFVVK